MSADSPYLLHGLRGCAQMITPEIILYGQVATGRTPSKRASPALPTPGTQTQDIPQPGCCCMSRCNLTLSVLGGDSPMEPTPSLQDLGAFLTTCAAHTARGGQGHLMPRERTARTLRGDQGHLIGITVHLCVVTGLTAAHRHG